MGNLLSQPRQLRLATRLSAKSFGAEFYPTDVRLIVPITRWHTVKPPCTPAVARSVLPGSTRLLRKLRSLRQGRDLPC